ncbi:hypothetical protein SAMN03080601_03129 [Alkalitalea saponilacus]|uniref:Uncharacterized protein n=1 Tax=Alkalitalea saponilacus TaxID=889453 RepID=A0A1T5HT35_9BACT|nr:hypothetical protein SAMN03080601_03129 [Alkalitalea saponilacus]
MFIDDNQESLQQTKKEVNLHEENICRRKLRDKSICLSGIELRVIISIN